MAYLFRSLLIALIFVSQAIDAITERMIGESYLAKDNQIAFRQCKIEGDDVVVECYMAGSLLCSPTIGSLSYMKMSAFNNTYVIHSLYVYPEHRNKGYGSALLNYACDYLQSMGATAIYVQPGPFELEKVPEGCLTTVRPTGELYAAKIQQLIAFYKKNQFVPANKWLILVIGLLYEWTEINEDAQYLMVKEIK